MNWLMLTSNIYVMAAFREGLITKKLV